MVIDGSGDTVVEGASITGFNEEDKLVELVDKAKVEKQADVPPITADPLVGGYKFCQRCGHDTTQTMVGVTDADKESFFNSILGDIPFEKTYPALNGKIQINMSTSPAWFSQLISDQLTIDFRVRKVTTGDEFKLKMYKYYIVGNLKRLTIGGKVKFESIDISKLKGQKGLEDLQGNTALHGVYEGITSTWNDAVVSAIIEVESKFMDEVEYMTRHVNDSNFWTSVSQV